MAHAQRPASVLKAKPGQIACGSSPNFLERVDARAQPHHSYASSHHPFTPLSSYPCLPWVSRRARHQAPSLVERTPRHSCLRRNDGSGNRT